MRVHSALLSQLDNCRTNNCVSASSTLFKKHDYTPRKTRQTVDLQVRAFFERLNDLHARYKLVWFTDFQHKYREDSVLNFMYTYLMAFLDASEYAEFVEKFSNPLSPDWDRFLKRLTPSFMLMSVDNPCREVVKEEIAFIPAFSSIGTNLYDEIIGFSKRIFSALQLMSFGIPVIYFEAFAINFSTVFAYRIKVVSINVVNMNERISQIWSKSAGV